MNEQVVQRRLDLLFKLGITLVELEEEKAQAIEAVIPHEVREYIEQIETEFADRIQAANVNYANTKAAIKDDVLALGFTVEGANNMMAIWNAGKPSVSIRRRK